jgi:hypothetical protein
MSCARTADPARCAAAARCASALSVHSACAPRRLVDLYRQAHEQSGKRSPPLAVHPPGDIAETDEQAHEKIWPHDKALHDRIGAECGWQPVTRTHFLHEVGHGSLHVGAPGTVTRNSPGRSGRSASTASR